MEKNGKRRKRIPTGHSWKLPTWRPFLDQKQTETISSCFLMLSRVEEG
jgi:hypothetical protein